MDRRKRRPRVRPIAIVAVCIVGFIFSSLDIWAQIIPPFAFEDKWRFLLLANGAIFFLCWIGLWMMRKLAYVALVVNFIFMVLLHYLLGLGLLHISYMFYIIAILIGYYYWSDMKKWL